VRNVGKDTWKGYFEDVVLYCGGIGLNFSRTVSGLVETEKAKAKDFFPGTRGTLIGLLDQQNWVAQ
jgi:hypothetical protein